MMTRYDLMSPRPRKDGQTGWHKVGAAFPRDKGGFSLVFDSLPLPDAEGRVSLMMWEAKPRDDNRQQRSQGQQGGGYAGGSTGAAPAFDDDVPFAPCVLL